MEHPNKLFDLITDIADQKNVPIELIEKETGNSIFELTENPTKEDLIHAAELLRTDPNQFLKYLDHPEPTENSGHLEILEQGVNAWSEWRYKFPDVSPNLEGADLHGKNLVGINLRGANLEGANLVATDLERSDLRGTNLIDADLRGVILKQANLNEADLRQITLTMVDLSGANLRDANLNGAELVRCELEGSDLTGTGLVGADMREARLSDANLRQANLSDADLRGADLSRTDLTDADLRGTDLLLCTFDMTILEGTKILGARNAKEITCDDPKVRHWIIDQAYPLPEENIDPNMAMPTAARGVVAELLEQNLTLTTISKGSGTAYDQLINNDEITLRIGHPFEAGQLVLLYLPKGLTKKRQEDDKQGIRYLYTTQSASISAETEGTNRQFDVALGDKVELPTPITVEQIPKNSTGKLSNFASVNFARLPYMNEPLNDEEAAELWELILGDADNLGTLRNFLNARRDGSDNRIGQDYSSPFLKPEGVPGFKSDHVQFDGSLEDKLSIQSEVDAFSALICAEQTPLPLAIGLFGDWGSGKSHFMGMMQQKINELSAKERNARPDDNPADADSNYCKHVAQITFNAWQYVDTHLWASLVTHIYHELADEMSRLRKKAKGGLSNEDSPSEIRKQLLKGNAFTEEIIAEQEELINRLGAAQKDIESIITMENKEGKRRGNLVAKTFLSELIERSEFKDEYAEIRQQMSFAHGSFLDLQRKTQSLEPITNRLIESVRARPLLFLSAVVGALMLGTFAHDFVESGDAAMNTLRGIVGGVSPLIAYFGSQLTTINKALGKWVSFKDRLNLAESKEREKQDQVFQRQLNQLEQQRERAEAAMSAAQAELDSSKEKLESLSSSRQFYDHVLAQGKRSEYQGELGIMSVIHNDFQELNKRLDASDKIPAPGEVQLPKVDRIVLYIDDLDRCPSKKIVEVL
jgi:uncharacterized protein YjbI with pentapeptide repeats